MSNNKFFLITATFLSAMILSFFSSCGDDDEDKNKDMVSIVGTWRYEYGNGNGYDITTFNYNGYGTLEEHKIYNGKEEIDYEKFKYVFDSNTMTIAFFFWDEDEKDYAYDESWHISSISANKMIIEGETWIRIK